LIESQHEDANIQIDSLADLNSLIKFTSMHRQRIYPGWCSCH